jgi:4-aminobutyrate aminotransferase
LYRQGHRLRHAAGSDDRPKKRNDLAERSHGNTYGGNPISCAASLATLELIETEYKDNAAKVGAYTQSRLKEIQERHECIGEVRGIGMMIALNL